ncbi:MAG: hypothetical protein WBD55_05235, partial [Dehalococcoidia bacterium]
MEDRIRSEPPRTNDTMLAYFRWALSESIDRWSSRVDAYIALATYAVLLVGASVMPFVGKWDAKIDVGFHAIAVALAIFGVATFLYHICLRTPKRLWIAL